MEVMIAVLGRKSVQECVKKSGLLPSKLQDMNNSSNQILAEMHLFRNCERNYIYFGLSDFIGVRNNTINKDNIIVTQQSLPTKINTVTVIKVVVVLWGQKKSHDRRHILYIWRHLSSKCNVNTCATVASSGRRD